ncbi:unnamed protein product [Closterium sp. Yama58-4]|nr:unnamed protein product [Closterium sp. Yama58-4]
MSESTHGLVVVGQINSTHSSIRTRSIIEAAVSAVVSGPIRDLVLVTLGAVAALLTTALVLWLRRRAEQQTRVAAPLLPALPSRASSFSSSPQIATAAATSSAGETNGAFSALFPTQRAANGALLSVDHGFYATAVANAAAATATADRSADNADYAGFGGPVAAENGRAYSGYAALNGAASNGKALNGYASNGAASNGHAVNGYALHGAASNGHALNGAASNGHALNGANSNGHALNGHAVNGHAVNGDRKLGAPTDVGVGMQKESVEWVNMVLHKMWKVYRQPIETWLVTRIQRSIDKLQPTLPPPFSRVEITVFTLDYEPFAVRAVQQRPSRKADDLQYHVGVRYTGDAHCMIRLHLEVGGLKWSVPVDVHDLDVDAEVWVKLRLTPKKPFVASLSLAFVRLPTIKLVLAPFHVLNVVGIPFLSKLLTEDLPRLLVLPRHISLDFLPPGMDADEDTDAGADVAAAVAADVAAGVEKQGREAQWVNEAAASAVSKRNRQTSHAASPGDPVWNQDFLFCVESPKRQKLTVVVRDSALFQRDLGFVQVPLNQLQDCIPVSMWLPLLQDGPFGVKPAPQGEVRLVLTYKSYVEEGSGRTTVLGKFGKPNKTKVRIRFNGDGGGEEGGRTRDGNSESDKLETESQLLEKLSSLLQETNGGGKQRQASAEPAVATAAAAAAAAGGGVSVRG